MTGAYWGLWSVVNGEKIRPITIGDLSEEYGRLPQHKEMSEIFIASQGKIGRKKFKTEFNNAPDWAYDFLRAITGHAGGDAPDYEGVEDPLSLSI